MSDRLHSPKYALNSSEFSARGKSRYDDDDTTNVVVRLTLLPQPREFKSSITQHGSSSRRHNVEVDPDSKRRRDSASDVRRMISDRYDGVLL